MSCNSCSSITLPVGATGVQGATGLQGPIGNTGGTGAAGAAGAAGADGVAVLYESTAINSPSTIGNSFTDAVDIAIASNTIETVGDVIRMEFVVMNDIDFTNPAISLTTEFDVDVQFDGNEMMGYKFGIANSSMLECGAIVSLDLVVTASNTITPRLNIIELISGFRNVQYVVTPRKPAFQGITPAFGISGAVVSPATITLNSGTKQLKIRLKNSDNASTSVASVISATVLKLLKA